ERIAFGLIGDGTDEGKAEGSVIACRGKDDGGTMSGLFMPRLRIEVKPNYVPAFGDVVWLRPQRVPAWFHSNSLPTGGPQSTSPWMFSGVTFASSWESVNFLRTRTSLSLTRSTTTVSLAKSSGSVILARESVFRVTAPILHLPHLRGTDRGPQ